MVFVVCDQLFAFVFFEQFTWDFLICKVACYHQFFVSKRSLICIDIIIIFQQSVEYSFHDHFILVTQPDQFLIVVEYTILVFQCCFCINLCIIFVYTDPGSSRSKSCICAVIPLHWCSGIVTADHLQAVQHFFFCHQPAFCILFVCIDCFDVSVITDRFEICICHTYFFSLINIWRSF